jgi:hypothetical protein
MGIAATLTWRPGRVFDSAAVQAKAEAAQDTPARRTVLQITFRDISILLLMRAVEITKVYPLQFWS